MEKENRQKSTKIDEVDDFPSNSIDFDRFQPILKLIKFNGWETEKQRIDQDRQKSIKLMIVDQIRSIPIDPEKF